MENNRQAVAKPRSSNSSFLWFIGTASGLAFAILAAFRTGDFLGWAAWGLLVFFCCTWSLYLWRQYASGQGVAPPMMGTVVTWWLLLGAAALNPAIEKLHLLWMAPASLLLSWVLPPFLLVIVVLVALFRLG